MDCVTVGTGGMMPMPLRFTSSVLVRREGRMLLFDAGEGIQIALKRGGLGIRSLDAVAVTHLHADHVLGLPGILMFRAQNDEPGPLTIIGPPGIAKFVRHTLEDLRYHVNFELHFVEFGESQGSVAWLWHGAELSWAPVLHSTFCLGYRLEEPPRPGRFYPERAAALGVPMGPLYSALQAGREVEVEGQRVVRPDEVLGPPRRGRSVAYVTDTRPCKAIAQLCRGVDLAFVEGMFAAEHEAAAAEKAHMTARQAAAAAAEAGAARLVIIHISPRYSREDEAVLEAEAQAVFAKSQVAKQLGVYEIPLPE